MTREEKDKLLALMGEERNSYSEHINKEIARLYGKIEGADYILNRLLDYFHNDSEEEGMTQKEYEKIIHLMKHGSLQGIDTGRLDGKCEDVIPLEDAISIVDLVYKAETENT